MNKKRKDNCQRVIAKDDLVKTKRLVKEIAIVRK